MQPHSTDKIYSSTGTDIVFQLVLLFTGFVKRCSTEVRDGDTAACAQCKQEDQASSPLVQREYVPMALIKSDPGQVNFTPVHTNTHTHRPSQTVCLC